MKKLFLFATMLALFTSLGAYAQNPNGVPVLVSKTYLDPNGTETRAGYSGKSLEVIYFSSSNPHIISAQTSSPTDYNGVLIIKHKANNNILPVVGQESDYYPISFNNSFTKPTCTISWLPDNPNGTISSTLTVGYRAKSQSTGAVTTFYETTTFYHYPKYFYMPM